MSQEQNIGRYEIKSIIGEGAMGRVFKCYDPNLERSVAIKKMRTANIQSGEDLAEFKDRFFQEARVSGRLNHPNIVGVYDSGLQGKEPYLVMELIEGQPLDKFVKKEYPVCLKNYLSILEQTASALDFAHEEEVIHRDIKPGNILVSPSRRGKFRVKIVDFGLAKLKDSKITQTGFFLGTPSYSSPEQIINGRVDTRSDLYSLGTVAYEMLTRMLPFEAESLHSILYQIANEPPKIDFSGFADQLDIGKLEAVFLKIFHKDPGERHQTARAFVRDLREPLKDLGSIKPPPHPKVEVPSKLTPTSQPPSPKTRSFPAQETVAAKDRGQVALIEQARSQFKQAYRTGNVSSIRYCLMELRRLGADVTEENELFVKLENEIKSKGLGQELLIAKARSAFKLALNAKNLHSSNYCLSELRDLGADVSSEEKSLADLERELTQSEKEARRTLEVQSLRRAFQEKVQQQDVKGAEKAFEEMKALGIDHDKESAALNKLAKALEARESQRQSWITRSRNQFKQAISDKNTERCRQLILDLENLLKTEASEEKEALARLEAELVEQTRQAEAERHIQELRDRFQALLADRNVKDCKRVLDELVEREADVKSEKKALKKLRNRIRKEEEEQLKKKIIAKTRDNFRKAIEAENPDKANYYLKELRQLVSDPGPEEKTIGSLKRRLRDREVENIKENVLRHLRNEFKKAVGQGNLERARYYLKELEINQADVSAERETLAELERRSSVEEEMHEKMIRQARHDFQKALSVKNGYVCEHHLGVLAGFGADVSFEIEALDAMKREEEECLKDPKKKAQLIERLRYEFLQALKSENMGSCRYFLEKLEDLQAENKSESEALSLLSAKFRL